MSDKESIDGSDPAFACSAGIGHQSGLTKREYFAAAAMQGMISNGRRGPFSECAEKSVKQADALLKALEGE